MNKVAMQLDSGATASVVVAYRWNATIESEMIKKADG